MEEYIEREAVDAAIKAAADHRKAIGVPGEQAGFLQAHDIVRSFPAADVVELPCRIGDTVWCIRSFRGIDHPQETKVSGMYFTQDMRLNIQCKYVGIGEFGKKVFKTREDAMKAMEGQRA